MEEIKRIPLSRIRAIVEEKLDNVNYCVVEEIPQEILGIPVFISAIPGNNNFAEGINILPMPPEIVSRYAEFLAIMSRVVGTADTDRYFELNRGDSIFPWELHKVVVDEQEYYVGCVDPEGTDEDVDPDDEDSDYYKNVTLYPCSYVDPDS